MKEYTQDDFYKWLAKMSIDDLNNLRKGIDEDIKKMIIYKTRWMIEKIEFDGIMKGIKL